MAGRDNDVANGFTGTIKTDARDSVPDRCACSLPAPLSYRTFTSSSPDV
jgi:hypothetical protein